MSKSSGRRSTSRQIQASDLVPAPYLAGAPSLPAELAEDNPSPAQQRRAQRLIANMKRQLFLLRSSYEIETGVKIVSEPTPVI